MIKLKEILLNEYKRKYKKHWSYEAYTDQEEELFDEIEDDLKKMFGKDKIFQINDFIYSIFDVMATDEWLDKYTGINKKAILKYAKRKGLAPIKRPIK